MLDKSLANTLSDIPYLELHTGLSWIVRLFGLSKSWENR